MYNSNIDKVIESIQEGLKNNPDDSKLIEALGEAYVKKGLFDGEALRIYEEVLKKNSHHTTIQEARSIVYVIQEVERILNEIDDPDKVPTDTFDSIRPILLRASKKYNYSSQIFKTLADILLIQKKFDSAFNFYNHSIELGYMDFTKIIRIYNLFTKKVDCSVELLKHHSLFCIRDKDIDKAIQDFETIIEKNPDDESSLKRLLKLYIKKHTKKKKDLITTFRIGEIYLQLKEFSLAINYFEQALNDKQLQNNALINIGKCYVELGKYEDAFEYLSRTVVNENVRNLLNIIAENLEMCGNYTKTLEVLQFINKNSDILLGYIASNEKELTIHTALELSDRLMARKKYTQATQEIIKVYKLDYRNLGELYNKLKKISYLDPTNTDALYYQAQISLKKNNKLDTVNLLNDLINIDPYYPTVKESLLELYEDLLTTNSDMPEIRMNSGKLHRLMSNHELAIKDFKTLIDDVSYKNEALIEISNCYISQEKYEEVINTFKSVNLNNELDEYLYNLSSTFEEKGLSSLYSELLNLIYQNNSEFKDVAEKIKKISKAVPSEQLSPYIDKRMINLIGDHAIGRYEYIEKIGSGGMGVVHKVFDRETNQIVAMKILREGLTHSGRAIERFFREARIASQLNHINIINIIDYNISSKGGHCYITMEYVDGISLRELIERKFADSKDLVVKDIVMNVDYCVQLCDALEATHSQGIIHRDIKPDNIMVNSQGIVKITDFGIVHVDEATFTPTGALIGTPRYMSPEQVLGTSIDARSDIYSVGIILYEVMIGSPPFISGDIAFQQVNIIPTRPKLILADVPEELDDVIMKCLEKDPDKRFQSSKDLKFSLQAFLTKYQSSSTTPTATKS